MLKHIEQLYLYRLARDLRKAGFSRQATYQAIRKQVGPISTAFSIRCATNYAFED